MREYNYPDPDKKIIAKKDWVRLFGENQEKLDKKENVPQELTDTDDK